jgi:hypothetical protein
VHDGRKRPRQVSHHLTRQPRYIDHGGYRYADQGEWVEYPDEDWDAVPAYREIFGPRCNLRSVVKPVRGKAGVDSVSVD